MPFGKISCFMYWLNLILNFNQGLVTFRRKQILRSNRYKDLLKRNSDDFFFRLFNAWPHFTNNNFPTPTLKKIFLTNPYFWNHSPNSTSALITNIFIYTYPPWSISKIFTITKDLYKLLKPGLISSRTSDEKLGFPTANHKKIYKLCIIVDFDSKHLRRTETSQKSLSVTTITTLRKWKTLKNSILNNLLHTSI